MSTIQINNEATHSDLEGQRAISLAAHLPQCLACPYLPTELWFQIIDEVLKRIIHIHIHTSQTSIRGPASILIVTPPRRPHLFYEPRIWPAYQHKYIETTLPGFRTPFFFNPCFDTLYFTSPAAIRIFLENNSPAISSSTSSTPRPLRPARSLLFEQMKVRTLATRFSAGLSTDEGIQPVVDMLRLFATVEVLIVTVRERQIVRAAGLKKGIVERTIEGRQRDEEAAKEAAKDTAEKTAEERRGVHQEIELQRLWNVPVIRFMTCAEFAARKGI